MSYEMRLLSAEIFARLSKHPCTTLCDLSTQLNDSKRTCQKTIRSCSGGTFRELQLAVLFNTVREILACQPTIAIKELAYSVGFKSPRSFARAVRHISGHSPKELRALVSLQNPVATDQLTKLRIDSLPIPNTQMPRKSYT